MNLENLRVQRGGNEYCLMSTLNGDHYHVWLSCRDYSIQPRCKVTSHDRFLGNTSHAARSHE